MVDIGSALWFKGRVKKIPVVYSEDFLTDYPTVDCESPERAWIIHAALRDVAEFHEAPSCNTSELLLCHTEPLVRAVEKESEVYPVAMKAAGGAVLAAEMALEQPTFALVRPPGHHAGRNFNGGFCFFNNMAVALSALLARGFVNNALIVDIDLHYGNGTEDIFKDDRRVAFRNIHAFHREEFLEALETALMDAHTFDIVGCSAGFDTYVHDWGGLLSTDDYRAISRLMVSANPRAFAILEGGYYISDLGKNVAAYVKGIQEACL